MTTVVVLWPEQPASIANSVSARRTVSFYSHWIGLVTGDGTTDVPQRKLSISAAESSTWSPSSKTMKCSVTVSPGDTGALVVSQPVEPPGMVASGGGGPGSNGSGSGGSSKPVPPMSLTGCEQCCVC